MAVGEPEDLSQSPAVLVAELCDILGTAEVTRWCIGLLCGRTPYDNPELPSLTWLGGGAGRAWDQHADAVPVVVGALGDESWRVREMAAKVVARHKVQEAAKPLCDVPPPQYWTRDGSFPPSKCGHCRR